MAGRYETKLNADRQKLKKSIEDLNTRRSNTSDSKQKRRLNTQIKSKTRQLNDLNQRSSGMRTGIDPKGGLKKRIPTQPTQQAHHYGSSLNNASAFFADLDPAEKILMEQKMAQYGIIPGDVTMNRLDMYTDLHQAGIHRLERELNLEGKEYFSAGSSFETKLNAVEDFAKDQRYLRQLAEEAQFKAGNELGGLSRRVEATATGEQAASYHDIERRRIAETTRDFREYAPKIHEQATALGPQILPDITDRPRLDSTFTGSQGSQRLNINAIMTKANMPALGGFVHHSKGPSVTADQSLYTPPKLQPSQPVDLPETPATPNVNMSPTVMSSITEGVETAVPYVVGAGAAILGLGLDVTKGVANLIFNPIGF